MRTMTRMQRVLLALGSIFLMGLHNDSCTFVLNGGVVAPSTITCSAASVTVSPSRERSSNAGASVPTGSPSLRQRRAKSFGGRSALALPCW